MTPLDNLLEQRGKTHGDYLEVCRITESIIEVTRTSPNWGCLPDTHRIAVYMIAMKLARMLAGDYNEPDHFADIAGYAKLVEKRINATRSSSSDK